MKNSLLKKIVWPLLFIPAAYLAIIWNSIPAQIAMQYDLRGNPTRYGNKEEMIMLVAILFAVTVLTFLLISNIHKFDPRNKVGANKDRLIKIAFAVAIFLIAIQCMMIYMAGKDNIQKGVSFILAAVGLLFAFIGNYLPNLKPNYFAGLRLPWTLENEDNWKKTHQLAGKLWFGGGLLIAVICLFLGPTSSLIVFFTIVAVITIIPTIYSYNFYRKQKSIHSL